jgi:transcriptional regulator with XRE-family HTH domain
MRGIAVDASRFRDIRLARGFTQLELALAAGVSERTVRNAESGRRVRYDFLKYLSVALGVDLADIALDFPELKYARREQYNAIHLATALEGFVSGDLAEYRNLLAANVVIRVHGPQEIPFTGQYRGFDGLRRLLEINERTVTYEAPLTITKTRSAQNLVVMEGIDSMRIKSTGKRIQGWWQHIYEFEHGRVVQVDDRIDTYAAMRAFCADP